MMRKHKSKYIDYCYEKPFTAWSSDTEIKSRLTMVDLADPQPIAAGGPPVLVEGKKAYIDVSDSHNAVCAISGMKKSICYFMPLIYFLGRAGENMAINDPKGELFDRTSGYLAREGYRVLCLDFRTMDQDGFNILEYPAKLYQSGDHDGGMMLLNDIVSTLAAPQLNNGRIDTFWPITASSYCRGTGAVMFNAFPKIEQINLPNWNRFNTEEGFRSLEQLIEHMDSDDTAILNLKAILTEPDKTLRSTISTAHSFMADFVANNKLARMLSHSTFQPKDLCRKKTVLYLITDDTASTYNALIGIILSQIRSFLNSEAYKNKNGCLETRFNYVLDETCSIPFPNLEQGLAVDRSRGIRYHLCIQSLAGLKLRYPEYEALLANCGNMLFLGSTEAEMLERVSMQLGKTNFTIDGKEKPLVSTAELMTLKKTWEYKEGIFMSLSDSIRYCTFLPSIESYPLGSEKPFKNKIQHPNVNTYAPKQLVDDIRSGRIPMPFSEPTIPSMKARKPSRSSSADKDLTAELERKFNELFGSVSD